MSGKQTEQIAVKDMCDFQLLCELVPSLREAIDEPTPANQELHNRVLNKTYRPFEWMKGCM